MVVLPDDPVIPATGAGHRSRKSCVIEETGTPSRRAARSGQIGGDALGDEDDLGVGGVLGAVFAEGEVRIAVGDGFDLFAQLHGGPRIGHSNRGPFDRQVTHEVNSLDSEANNRHPSPE